LPKKKIIKRGRKLENRVEKELENTEKKEKKENSDTPPVSVDLSTDSAGFNSQTSKKRTTDKVKEKLPTTPSKKADIIQSLASSPRTRNILSKRGLLSTPEEKKISTLQ